MGDVAKLDQAAEGATLAAALTDEAFRAEVLSGPEDLFGEGPYRLIRQAMGQLTERGEAVDPVTVAREAQGLGLPDAEKIVWGLPQANTKYLSLLARSRMQRKTWEIARMLASSTDKPEERLERAAEMALATLAGPEMSMSHTGQGRGKTIPHFRAGPSRLIHTGIPTLDDALRFLDRGEMLTIGARPGIGKSAFANQVAVATARAGAGVLMVSLEMSFVSITSRMIAHLGEIDHSRLQDWQLTPDEQMRLGPALQDMDTLPIGIVDHPGLTPLHVRAALLRNRRIIGVPVRVVIVDYLQLLSPPPDQKSPREYERITYLSGALREIARKTGVVVIALSQLNRGTEMRADRKPDTADLRGSGSIEQDSDAILLLHRPEGDAQTELLLAKNRAGITGVAKAEWDAPKMTFRPVGP